MAEHRRQVCRVGAEAFLRAGCIIEIHPTLPGRFESPLITKHTRVAPSQNCPATSPFCDSVGLTKSSSASIFLRHTRGLVLRPQARSAMRTKSARAWLRPCSSTHHLARHLTAHREFSRTISRILRAGPSLYLFRSSLGYLCRYTREITDALVSDRRRPRLFADHSVDRPGTGGRLDRLRQTVAEQC
jgi:hypothetical protein